MDPPPYARYVPLSPPSQLPPPPPGPPPYNLTETPNFYRHEPHAHHNHHAPPQQQPLPPPQQQLLRPPPQRQTYDPQFFFKPNLNNNSSIEDNYHHHHSHHHSNPRSHHNNNQIQNPPRVYDHHHLQVTEFVDTVYREPRQTMWNPPAASRHGLEARSWFDRDGGYSNQLQRKEILSPDAAGGEDYYRREYRQPDTNRSSRDFPQSDTNRSSRDIGTVSNYGSLAKDPYMNSGNFNDQYGSGELMRSNGREVINENQKRSHGRMTQRDVRDSLKERVNDEGSRMTQRDARDSLNERVNDEVGHLGSIKHEYRGSESGRYVNKGSSREGTYEFNQSSRKQPQKKSAFLRIQMAKPSVDARSNRITTPSYRNREDERPYCGKDNKEQHLEGEGEGSHMELDVSFKSNSLVAKAVLTPSSSGVVSESSLTPRNSKVRKVLMSDKEFSSSPVSKLDEARVKLGSSVHTVNGVSNSDKGPKQSGKEVTCTGSGNGGGGSTSSFQYFNGAKISSRKRKTEESDKNIILNQGGNGSSSGPKCLDLDKSSYNTGSADKGTVLDKAGMSRKVISNLTVSNNGNGSIGAVNKSFAMVVRKKKVVKKVLKKVVNPLSKLSHSQPKKKQAESLNNSPCRLLSSVESDNVTCLEERSPIFGSIPVPAVHMQPCPNNEVIHNRKVQTAPLSMLPNEVDCPLGSSNAATASFETGTIGRSLNAAALVADNVDLIPTVEGKSKTDASLLDLSSSMVTSMPVRSDYVVNPAHCVDTTLTLSVKDHSQVRDSSVTQFHAGLHPSMDEVRLADRNTSEMKSLLSSDFNVSISGISEKKNKRRKIAASHSGISSPRTYSKEEPANVDASTPGEKFPIDSIDALVQAENRMMPSIDDTIRNSALPQCPGKIISSHDKSSVGGSVYAVGSAGAVCFGDDQTTGFLVADSISGVEEAAILNAPSRSPATLVNKEIAEVTMLVPASDHQKDIPVMNRTYGKEEPANVDVSIPGAVCIDDDQKTDFLVDDCISNVEKASFLNAPSRGPSALVNKEIAEVTTLVPPSHHQNDNPVMNSSNGDEMDVDVEEDHPKIPSETSKPVIVLEHVSSHIDARQPSISNSFPLGKDCLSSVPNHSVASAVSNKVLISNTSNEQQKSSGGLLSDFLETLSPSGLNTLNCKATLGQFSPEKNDKIPNQNQKSVAESVPYLSALTQTTKASLKSENATKCDKKMGVGPLKSQKPKPTLPISNHVSGEMNRKNNQLSCSVPKAYAGGSSSVFSATKNTVSSRSITKARTWHRPSHSVASSLPEHQSISSSVQPPRPLQKRATKTPNTSYIRKGNSLVRKPALVSAPAQGSHTLSSSVNLLNSLGVDEAEKTSIDGADVTEQPTLRGAGVASSSELPRTPSLAVTSKVSNCSNSSEDFANSPVAEPSICETMLGLMKVTETNDVQCEDALKVTETSANQTGSGCNLAVETLSEQNHGNLPCSNTKQITYVKRKSNQLIATSSPCTVSLQKADKNSDSYYVRSKNKLIRTQLESHVRQMPDNASNSAVQTVPLLSMQSCGKKRSHKAAMKTRKPSKNSLVWTLRGTQVRTDNRYSMHRQILPQLVPWKRPIYRKSSKQYLASTPNSNSLSTVGRKLQLSRKRETIYTRSAHGFSLRKSRVLSIGGSNLTWSKSIERNSNKANEEATLAVVAAQKMRREQNTVAAGKKKKNSPRERVFRIGSFRYKMDSSRRALHRIPDHESSFSAACPAENNAKKSYVPSRLTIGNDEYIRVGNGNRLVRNPKKRTRVLASEKIRWSLHTARLKLFKKHQYCQFFTRFGTCNKEDGKKCPYIHDPSKIAVCTKFLNDMCSDPDCKLTHQVIPERMPDCSYYLQGLCTNKNCSYRHVHVNPKAAPCEGFLRGFCANGDECRKKHSYTCPIFEATGSCDLGSKCKLHHPKTQSKGKKNKRIKGWKNVEGRYFGSSSHVIVSKPDSTAVLEKRSEHDNGNMIFDGMITEYIPISFGDEEPGESNEQISQENNFCEVEPSDLRADDFDELIKPVRIMHNNV